VSTQKLNNHNTGQTQTKVWSGQGRQMKKYKRQKFGFFMQFGFLYLTVLTPTKVVHFFEQIKYNFFRVEFFKTKQFDDACSCGDVCFCWSRTNLFLCI